MIEKNSSQYSAIGIQKNSFQASALSPQLFPRNIKTENCSAKNSSVKSQSEAAVPAQLCRIVCDESSEDFRLVLCRTFCAGVCPHHESICVK
jgi:hypothetical protein